MSVSFNNRLNTPLNIPSNIGITKIALKKQANLFAQTYEGKKWANSQDKLELFSNTHNHVYELKRASSPNKIAAYFKLGQDNTYYSSLMEKLIWDIAVLMGSENFFTATKMTTLPFKTNRGQTLLKKGSIQPVVKGKQLLANLCLQNQISTPHLTKATVALLFFGMHDAHLQNIWITPKGKIVFFDNARSLTHSNGLIKRDTRFQPSIRSGLLKLRESYSSFTSEQREIIRIELERYRTRLPLLIKFLKSPHVIAQLNKLPPGWIVIDNIIEATEQRLEKLTKAMLNTEKVKNLKDLTFAIDPIMNFVGVLTILSSISKKDLLFLPPDQLNRKCLQFQIKYLEKMGSEDYDMKPMLNKCITQWSGNPLEIERICSDPALSFEEILKKCFFYVKTQSLKKTKVDKAITSQMLNSFNKIYKIDYKDWTEKYSNYQCEKETLFLLDEVHLYSKKLILTESDQENNKKVREYLKSKLKKKSALPILLTKKKGSFPSEIHLHYKSKNHQYFSVPLDYTSVPGKFIIPPHSTPLTASELYFYFYKLLSKSQP